MTRDERLTRVRYDIRERMVKAVFEPLAHTHEEAMEVHLDKVFTHLDHDWVIFRTQSIWTIKCIGLYDWHVNFDIDWRKDSCGLPYKAIDTFHSEYNPIADTAELLRLAVGFSSSFLATYNPDGTVREE